MDDASQSATFLEALQDVRRRLVHIAGRCFRQQNRLRLPFFMLAEGDFEAHDSVPGLGGMLVLGVNVVGSDGGEYELSLTLRRHGESWKIKTQACADTGQNELRHLRRFPERTAEDLASCLHHLRSAAEDLVGLIDVLA
jgi:hypothetical protein